MLNNTNIIWYRNRFRQPITTWDPRISSLPVSRKTISSNHNKNLKLWNSASAQLFVLHINEKFTMWKKNHLLYCKASFLIDLLCQFLFLGQSIRNRPSCTCGILSVSVFMINQHVARSRLHNYLHFWIKLIMIVLINGIRLTYFS